MKFNTVGARYEISKIIDFLFYAEAKDESGEVICKQEGLVPYREEGIGQMMVNTLSNMSLRNSVLDFLFKNELCVPNQDISFKENGDSLYIFDKKSGIPLFAAHPVPQF